MKAAVARTHGPQVVGGVGGFAGLYDLSLIKGYRRPLLAGSTDGVGTKVAVARALDTHDTIGLDLVAMVVDDVVVCGAKPLVMTDYIACGQVVPERIAAVVAGIAKAANSPAARSSAARLRSTPACWSRTSTTWRVPPSAWWRPTSCWDRPGSSPATPSWPSRAAACTRTGTPSSGRCSRAPAGRTSGMSTSWAARSARNCSSRPGSTP